MVCMAYPTGFGAPRFRGDKFTPAKAGAGMTENKVDLNKAFYDPAAKFREMAMKGKLSDGPGNIKDPRSRNIRTL